MLIQDSWGRTVDGWGQLVWGQLGATLILEVQRADLLDFVSPNHKTPS
jgi:hypothetical protein